MKTLNKKSILLICIAIVFAFMLILSSCEFPIKNQDTSSDTDSDFENDTPSAPHEHSYSEWETTKEATCTEEGAKERKCSCGDKQTEKTQTIPHTYENSYICSVCNQELQTSVGLIYTLSDDETYYTVLGIGTCTDTSIIIPYTYKGLPVTSIGDESFVFCRNLTSVIIPNSITSIGCASFADSGLTSITIPKSVTSIGELSFALCNSLDIITVDENNEYYKSIDGNLYSKDGKSLIQYAMGKDDTHFEIPDNVISISDGAFYYCQSLTSIVIPDSVTSIGNDAFRDCRSLTSIVIPDSVTSIGLSPFYDCTSLTIYCETKSTPSGWDPLWDYSILRAIVWDCNNNDVADDGYIYTVIDGIRYGIKDNVATVVEQPKNIVEATIPSTITYKDTVYPVTSIEERAFSGCNNLTNITVDENNEYYKSIDGNLYSKDGKSLIQYAIGKDDTHFEIPNGVTGIGNHVFYGCDSLTSIIIPNSITSIDISAFTGCNNLTNITVDENNEYYKSIDGNLYSKDGKTLIKYAIGKKDTHFEIPYGVTKIAGLAFQDNSSLTNVIISDSVTCIDNSAFIDCDSLTSIIIPDSVTSIGQLAFYNCDNLTIYCEASSPSGYHENWFDWVSNVVWGCNIDDMVSNNYTYASIDGLMFGIKNNVAIVVSQSSDIVKANIPNFITYKGTEYPVISIKKHAFYSCSSLTSVSIPNSVSNIEANAFQFCNSLTIYCEAERQPSNWNSCWNNSGYPVVWDCNNNDVADDGYIYTVIDGVRYKIKDNVATVAKQPANIVSAIIPSFITYKDTSYDIRSIGDKIFSDCSNLTSITVNENNEYYKSIDGNLYSKDGKTLIQYAIGKDTTHFEIPNGVTSIGKYAFSGCDSLTSIIIPNSMTSIEDGAFYDCDLLNFNEYDNAYYLGNEQNPYLILIKATNESITSCTISENTTIIYHSAFWDCINLTDVTIPNSVTRIEDFAFYGCDSLTSIIIPDSVTSIGNSAFDSCFSLTNVLYIGTIEQWCNILFESPYSNPLCYSVNLYFNGESVTNLVVPNTVTMINDFAFYGYYSLRSVTIGNNVRLIGSYAFYDCDSLTSITVDESNEYYKSIDDNLYSKDGKTLIQYAIGKYNTDFEIPSSVTSIDDCAFQGCISLTSIVIPDSVTSIGNYAFSNCHSLTSIVIPYSVTSISDDAFCDCNNLTIYCEATSQPSTWSYYWNYSNCPVVWGHVHSYENGECVCGMKQE